MKMEELEENKKSLATIERLIQQLPELPEVMAATYIQMNEEYEAARMQVKAAQIFGKLLL